jgi:hypothetical protein
MTLTLMISSSSFVGDAFTTHLIAARLAYQPLAPTSERQQQHRK